jgi:hypothetical protein
MVRDGDTVVLKMTLGGNDEKVMMQVPELSEAGIKHVVLTGDVPLMCEGTVSNIRDRVAAVGGGFCMAEIPDSFSADTALRFMKMCGKYQLAVYETLEEALEAIRDE